MKIGLYGGSFNPVHIGHLLTARDALEQFGLDEIRWVPAAVSPFKERDELAADSDRLEMLRQATCGEPRYRVETLELDKGGTSYTIDTVTALQTREPGHQWFLLIGLDSLSQLHAWRRVDELLDRCTVLTAARPGSTFPNDDAFPAEQLEALRTGFFTRRQIDISSSEIRNRCHNGQSIRHLVPDCVADYIDEHGLFRSATPGIAETAP